MTAWRNALLSATVTLLAACLAPLPAAANDGKILNVGLVLRLDDKFNGQFNETVSAMAEGIETARALFESLHPGVRIKLHRYPHGKDLESVVAAADRLIRDKIPAAIGGELSEEAFVLRDKLGPRKIVFITPTGSNPAITENQPYAFRACFSDRFVASGLAAFTIDRLKPRAVGLIHNVSSAYTDFLGRQFLETFGERMSKSATPVPIYAEKVVRDTMDFGASIRRFIENRVTHVVMPTHQSDLLRFALQAADQGFFPVYVGSDGWGSNEQVLAKLVKHPAHGAKFMAFRNSYMNENADAKMARMFRERYESMHTHRPTAWSAVAFDAAWVLFTAMESTAEPRTGDSIRDALLGIKGLQLVTSESFSFGPDNSPRKDLHIYRLDKDGSHYEEALR